MSAAIDIVNLSKNYGNLKALDSVSLTVQPGQFNALLGPNGAGKTTLFQLLSGLFHPDQGNIHIQGINLAERPTKALACLGIVFQQQTLDLDLSVRQNLRYHCALHGMNTAQAASRIDEELVTQGLVDVAHKRCRTLSGGNRRRVELARAMLTSPKILLMDEPTVGLDAASRSRLLQSVKQACRERNVAVLWTTHLVDEVENSDVIYILEKGNIITSGSAASICQQSHCCNLTDAFTKITNQSHSKPLDTVN